MMKIAHMADTHLGHRQYGIEEREDDLYEAFQNVIDDMIERDVDVVLHSGDLFQNPKPQIKAILAAKEGFEKLKKHNIPVYAIAGNHDIMRKSGTKIPHELFIDDNFHVLTTRKNHVVVNGEVFIAGLPFLQRSEEKVIEKLLEQIQEASQGYKYKILMLHGAMEKFNEGTFEYEFSNKALPEGFDYFAMGHIHQKLTGDFKGAEVAYAGSIERIDKKEQLDHQNKPKGYNLLTLENGKVEYEEIAVPLKREFLICDIEYPKFDEQLEDLVDKIITINEKTKQNPILHLTVKDGRFEKSEVSPILHKALDDITLTLKVKYRPIEDDDEEIFSNVEKEHLTPEYFINERIMAEFENETISRYAVDLYEQLAQKNMEESGNLASRLYDEIYNEN